MSEDGPVQEYTAAFQNPKSQIQNPMTIQQLLFILVAVVVLGSAILVVTTRNLFHAALFLVVSFFGVAAFYVLLDAGFFAAAQVLVYIGAIAILFIFAVMLTRDVITAQRANSQWTAAAILGGLIFIVMAILLGPIPITYGPVDFTFLGNRTYVSQRQFGNVQWPLDKAPDTGAIVAVPQTYISDLGRALVDFNQYAVPFLLGAVMLLVAMVGAIWVAREMRARDLFPEPAEHVDADEPLVQEPLALPDNAVVAEKH
jgi:NADH-quinone oxidoreductase subunit J